MENFSFLEIGIIGNPENFFVKVSQSEGGFDILSTYLYEFKLSGFDVVPGEMLSTKTFYLYGRE